MVSYAFTELTINKYITRVFTFYEVFNQLPRFFTRQLFFITELALILKHVSCWDVLFDP